MAILSKQEYKSLVDFFLTNQTFIVSILQQCNTNSAAFYRHYLFPDNNSKTQVIS